RGPVRMAAGSAIHGLHRVAIVWQSGLVCKLGAESRGNLPRRLRGDGFGDGLLLFRHISGDITTGTARAMAEVGGNAVRNLPDCHRTASKCLALVAMADLVSGFTVRAIYENYGSLSSRWPGISLALPDLHQPAGIVGRPSKSTRAALGHSVGRSARDFGTFRGGLLAL